MYKRLDAQSYLICGYSKTQPLILKEVDIVWRDGGIDIEMAFIPAIFF